MMELPLGRSAIDHDTVRRSEPDLLPRLLENPQTQVLVMNGSLIPVEWEDGSASLVMVPGSAQLLRESLPYTAAYLGVDSGTSYAVVFADADILVSQPELAALSDQGVASWVDDGRADGTRCWESLRQCGWALGAADAGMATQAVALQGWHQRTLFCSHCGAPLTVQMAGWERVCTEENLTHFPRTDPAVIVAVLDREDRLLLSHAVAWEGNRYSITAGFLEAGESVETTVRREVPEETGISVERVQYLASQSWPFPRSLMVGCAALAEHTDIRVDGEEIARAQWFTREQLAQAVADGSVILPPATSIARTIIEAWRRREIRFG